MLVAQEYLDRPKVFVSAEQLFEQFMVALGEFHAYICAAAFQFVYVLKL